MDFCASPEIPQGRVSSNGSRLSPSNSFSISNSGVAANDRYSALFAKGWV